MSTEELQGKDITYVVLFQELLGVVVAVNVDLGQRVKDGGILAAGLDACLEPGQDELQPVTSLHFVHELVNGKVAGDRS